MLFLEVLGFRKKRKEEGISIGLAIFIINIYVCIYVYTHKFIQMYTHRDAYICVYIYTLIHICTYKYMLFPLGRKCHDDYMA